ncbi:tRNA (adenosine(37)-N6)-dimethylallyltransferase MiaA [Alicyclobacillus sp.]|uniref:tRNA (adenosine(37)-N6)-dimethylallyltransferase MiaA n=1 Tax=Alicyclobacillus sp. TaxID=61169 RepID=UPI0025C58711|nr:tRNA (adenosine(37)-N6)-dimethylallyltransferase MiaA [Alicyclobacillus sp.]MCL6518093.1 tRNA (adenosine(37)-N6)-dimethylallyltransferase MiaA [Alicyclobacillus sp.]
MTAQQSQPAGPVLCIVGPTATGKSELGVLVAKAVGGEVISADSMQVYRGMDIGTAKLTPGEMAGVPHHLLDLVDPDERFTVADWKERADRVIARLHHEGRLPIVVGGTGLYIRALTEDLDFAGAEGSEPVRERLRAFAAEHGNEALHRLLAARDPESARRLHPNDVKRVIRAIEVAELGRSPMSQGYQWTIRGGRYRVVLFGITMDRARLYQRVNTRVDEMMARGLLDEVRRLLERGYDRSLPSMQAIGYKELAAHLAGEMSLEEAVARIKQNTRRFVKRQLSWFRRDPRIVWLDRGEMAWPDEAVERVLPSASALAAGIPVQERE